MVLRTDGSGTIDLSFFHGMLRGSASKIDLVTKSGAFLRSHGKYNKKYNYYQFQFDISSRWIEELSRNDVVEVWHNGEFVAVLRSKGLMAQRDCVRAWHPPTVDEVMASEGLAYLGVIHDPASPSVEHALIRGDVGKWLFYDDYPPRARREARAGASDVEVRINAEGRVSACRIARSSGSNDLDERACKNVSRRAHFFPARRASGKAVVEPVPMVVRVEWRNPEILNTPIRTCNHYCPPETLPPDDLPTEAQKKDTVRVSVLGPWLPRRSMAVTLPKAVGDPKRWVNADDIWFLPLNRRRGSTVWLTAIVGTNGRLGDCKAARRHDYVPEVATEACRMLVRNGLYRPARDATGAPTPHYIVHKVDL